MRKRLLGLEEDESLNRIEVTEMCFFRRVEKKTRRDRIKQAILLKN